MKKFVEITKRPYLTKGQTSLYIKIQVKLEKNEKLTFNEVRDIYINWACRDVRKGVPYFWNWWWRNEKDEMVGRSEPMSEEQINISTITWLTHNLGCLVLKGYLKVLPAIELESVNKRI